MKENNWIKKHGIMNIVKMATKRYVQWREYESKGSIFHYKTGISEGYGDAGADITKSLRCKWLRGFNEQDPWYWMEMEILDLGGDHFYNHREHYSVCDW